MNKVLVLLPDAQTALSKLDKNQYEFHFLPASEEAYGKSLMTFEDEELLVTQPGFLVSYVERAVKYVKDRGITAIMYCADMASVVASVVCERTGLRGPTLESTFRSLHKYYSRVTERSDLWFDYIHLDEPAEKWKSKIRYPCFLKPPFLWSGKGLSCIHNEKEMLEALPKLNAVMAPFFAGWLDFFKEYLDLEKFPFAVENIVLVEELVEEKSQYCIEAWADETGKCTLYCVNDVVLAQMHWEVILACITPSFALEECAMSARFLEITEKTAEQFGLRNTFFNIDLWCRDTTLILTEVNSRLVNGFTENYKKMWGSSNFESAVYLACGEMMKLMNNDVPQMSHEAGQPISGIFFPTTLAEEGKGREFIDYKYAREECIEDGVYSLHGSGMKIYVNEDAPVHRVSNSGVILCSFMLCDTDPVSLVKRAREVMKKTLLRPEDLSLCDLLPIT